MKTSEDKGCCCAAGDCLAGEALAEEAAITNGTRSQIWKYLIYSLPLLAAWWLIYSNLAPFSKLFTYRLLKLVADGHLGHAVEFFVYDTPKVLMLLTLVVFGVGIIRSFFTPDRTGKILAGKRESFGNILAALLGFEVKKAGLIAVTLFFLSNLHLSLSFADGESTPIPDVPAKDMVTMVDIGARECIPCKMMAPILESLEKEYDGRAAIIFIDVWKNKEQGKKFGIRSIPTQIFYDRDGKEVYRHEGFLDKGSIAAKLAELGVKSPDQAQASPESDR